MPFLRSLLFNVYYFASFVLTPLVLWVCLPLPRPYMVRGVRLWVRSLNAGLEWIAGLAYEVRGLENVPEGAAVFACKHQSAWETTVFFVLADDPAYVLKKELLFIPFWGWVGRKCKAIGVDRAGGIGALKRLVRESSAALDANRQVIIFPEGTRMAPGRTRPYHPGIAAIYAATEAPVVPVALNSGVFWGRRRFLKRPGVITLEFLPPVPRGLDRRAFLTELQARIETASERLRAEAEIKHRAESTGVRTRP
jgi:1-acyl-sn-glycerol-3-phosphate acyltransferase